MSNFEQNLKKAKIMCDGTYLGDYSTIYTFTTESISEYLKYFDLKDKSLLTVGSSGDQVLNTYFNGANDITLFDLNSLSKYYLYLKIAAILTLDYSEFKDFFIRSGLFSYKNKKVFCKEYYDRLKNVLKSLDYESYLFFEELFGLYDEKTVKNCLFNDDDNTKYSITCFNNYLKNEDKYNKLKLIIKDISFNFINGNIVTDEISGKYDNIFLSNLCTPLGLDKLKKVIKRLDENNLNADGSMLLAYLWDTDFYESEYSDEWLDIYKMPVIREKLKEYITEYKNIRGICNFGPKYNGKDDLVLIYRKK